MPLMQPIRLLLVDDHALFRAGLRSLLTSIGGFEIVAEASNGVEALELIDTISPDVVLMDLMMPGLNGLETTSRIVRKCPELPVVILSMNSAEEFVRPALQVGARGFLLKDASPDELTLALHQ